MTGFTDYQSAGIFPLQDHEPDIPISIRQMMVGGRVSRLRDPNEGGDDPENSMLEVGREENKGTLGDIHPWLFIQTRDRAVRGMGSWAQSFAAMTTGGGTGGSSGRYQRALAPSEVHPLRDHESREDKRYSKQLPGWPSCFPSLPQGVHVLLVPGTEETKQETLALHADPRLFAVHTDGAAEAGSLVCDLQPEAEPCMDKSSVPGQGGRHARLQSFLRVIPLGGDRPIPNLDAKAGNALAWNLSTAGVDEIAGFGMVWGRTLLSGPSTGGPRVPPGPITPGSPGSSPMGAASGTGGGSTREAAPSGNAGGSGAESAGSNGTPGTGGSEDEARRPGDFGKFQRKKKDGHAIALMAHLPAYGPFHIGADADQHRIGQDKDGHAINSGHIATGAYYFRNQREDAPLEFGQNYRKPQPYPLSSRVHLEFDEEPTHPKVGGSGKGLWRWRAEVPYVAPPTTREPGDPVPPRNPGGGPGTPGGPSFPRNPTTPGGPGSPGGPSTPGGGTRMPPGTGTGAPRRPDMPVQEIGPRNPSGPFNPSGGGFGAPEGGGLPGAGGGPSTPGSGDEPVPFDPEIDEWLKRERRKREKRPRRAGILSHVGSTTTADRSLYTILHPMNESFAELTWRPQRWWPGAESFTRNPHLPSVAYEDEEEERPQVLTAKSWAAQSGCEFSYTQRPEESRARGGTANGGILFAPPHLEMEDYLGINSNESLTTTSTTAYVTAAPNVAFALGVPSTDGGLEDKSFRIRQNPSATDRGISIDQQYSGGWVEIFAGRVQASSGEVIAELAQGGNQAVRIPRGDNSQRPSGITPTGGEIRINSNGASDVFEFWDEQGATWVQLTTGTGGLPPDSTYGDIEVTGGGSTWTITDAAIHGHIMRRIAARTDF